MNEHDLKNVVLDILRNIDYDMYKEAQAEPEEWDEVLRAVESIIIDVYNDGYALAEVDYNVMEKH